MACISKKLILLLCYFTIRLSYLIILPMMPFVIVEKGLRPSFSGWFVGIYGIFTTVGGVVGGKLVVTYGQHRVLVASFCTFAFMFLPIGAIDVMDSSSKIGVILLASRAIQGFTAGAAKVAAEVMLLATAQDD